jgi:hypothetical protein
LKDRNLAKQVKSNRKETEGENRNVRRKRRPESKPKKKEYKKERKRNGKIKRRHCLSELVVHPADSDVGIWLYSTLFRGRTT